MKNYFKLILKNTMLPWVIYPILDKLQKYKGIHKGETCYLFGTGQSIKYFDLSRFTDNISMPVNLFVFHKDFKKLQVPYSLLIEPYWFYPFHRFTSPPYQWMPNRIQKGYHNFMRENPQIQFFLNITNYPSVWEKNVTYVDSGYIARDLPGDHLAKHINCFRGSMRAAIFMAAYMGFSRAYLVGYDYTHNPAGLLHWYEKGKRPTQEMPGYEAEFFRIAKNFIDITNITLYGSSENVNSITYQDYTGNAPIFRENDELLSEEYMRLLSNWPGYKIY